MTTTKKTPKRQAIRKTEGTKVERIIETDIKKYIKPTQKTKINSQKGVDVIVRNGIRLDIEVKSAKEKTLYKDKNGVYKFRTGRFLLKISDYTDSDLFAFVIKKVDDKGRWNGSVEIYYIKTQVICNYLKERGLYKTRRDVKIGINAVKKLPITYLNPYFKGKINYV